MTDHAADQARVVLGAAWHCAAMFATHGRAGRLHVVRSRSGSRPDLNAAACGQTAGAVAIGTTGFEDDLLPLGEVAEVLRSQRSGCREHWPRSEDGSP
jgi:hypothetical protein